MPQQRIDARPALAATIAPLASGAQPLGVREAIAWLSELGLRGAQLSATDPATRPRDLGASARRDLRATLVRHELACSGIDFFIPTAHYTDPTHVSRAFDALLGAIGLAADLGGAPVTAAIPTDAAPDFRAGVAAEASRLGVAVLIPVGATPVPLDAPLAPSVDCAMVLGESGRPEDTIARLGPRLGGVRVVDLLRSGLRGPILERGESRLDALAVRMAIETSGFAGLPILDARQWQEPARGIADSAQRWAQLCRS
jgi:hypothetical protein